jgi:phage baseplate assembly protein W
MAIVTTNVARQFKDLDLNFNIHPVKKDINKHVDEMAVINSIKNLVLTSPYEKPFHPEISSRVRSLLFENMDQITASVLEREIEQVIKNYEPRVNVYKVNVSPDFDNNGFGVGMEFYIVNRTEPITIEFFLERVR